MPFHYSIKTIFLVALFVLAAGNFENAYGQSEDLSASNAGAEVEHASSIIQEKTFQEILVSREKRIAELVSNLQEEGIQESLTLLSGVNLFYQPGVNRVYSRLSMPHAKEVSLWDVQTIMSNRRYLKLFEELGAMDRSEAAKLVSEEIEQTIPIYRQLFQQKWETIMEVAEQHYRGGMGRRAAGFSMTVSAGSDDELTLAGVRLKVLSLALLAGNLNLYEARQGVYDILYLALEQRERMYTGSEAYSNRSMMLMLGSIYSRQVLATGLLGTTKDTEDIPEIARITKEMPSFMADTLPNDIDAMTLGLKADFSKGKNLIWYTEALDDEAFDALVKKMF